MKQARQCLRVIGIAKKSDAERLVETQRYYSLGNSFEWLHHDRRSLLSATGPAY